MQRSLSTFSSFADKHSEAFTVPSLRWLRFNQDENGFACAFVNVGRRVLIDELKAYEYIIPKTSQGKINWQSPAGTLSDCVMSLGLTVHGMRSTLYPPKDNQKPIPRVRWEGTFSKDPVPERDEEEGDYKKWQRGD